MAQVSRTMPLKRVVWVTKLADAVMEEIADILGDLNLLTSDEVTPDDVEQDARDLQELKKLVKEARKGLAHEISACHIVEAEGVKVLHAYEGTTTLDDDQMAHLGYARKVVEDAKKRAN
ncbi:MAG: hypothetical protein AAF211_00860, partial [Myxococcota bacterium]